MKEFRYLRGAYWFDVCIADATFVFFRNFLILQAATEQRYIFDYKSLLDYASEKAPLSKSQYDIMLSLRSAKNAYRKRHYDPTLVDALQAAQEIILCISDSMINPAAYAEHKKKCEGEDWYVRLRKGELELLEVYEPIYLDSISSEHPLFDKWNAIRSSGGYPKPRVCSRVDIESNISIR